MALIKSALSTALKPLGLTVKDLPQAPGNRKAPRIVLATVPRSGTMFLTQMLAANLDLGRIDIAPNSIFPHDNIDLRAMLEFSKGGYIATSHLNCSPFNLNLMKLYADKCVVQLRDPRAAVYSWTLTREWPRNRYKPHMWYRSWPTEPPNYFSLDQSEKLDWQIDNYLPGLVKWIADWVDVIDSGEHGELLVLTTHESLTGRDEDYVADLFRRMGVPVPEQIKLPPKDQSSHFRRGLKDEWRSAFSAEQIERATRQIPAGLIERFGWSAEELSAKKPRPRAVR